MSIDNISNMGKKNDKRLCWSCDGYVGFEELLCPYCGSDLANAPQTASITQEEAPPYQTPLADQFSVSNEEWNQAFDEAETEKKGEKDEHKNELVAIIMLIPGVVFLLFSLLLFLFSKEGVLHLEWKASIAYFYFIGALPLIYFGFKSLR